MPSRRVIYLNDTQAQCQILLLSVGSPPRRLCTEIDYTDDGDDDDDDNNEDIYPFSLFFLSLFCYLLSSRINGDPGKSVGVGAFVRRGRQRVHVGR